jgi:murein DD-endopeptidase MepM/ murein hydrolase activator NlpD
MRPNRAVSTIALALAAALAAPALADSPSDRQVEAALPQPAKAAAKTMATARIARREARADRGPVFPMTGEPDFGTAENGFGAARSGHSHSGQDIFAPSGTPLVAVTDAVVAEAGTDGGQGNYVHLYEERENVTYIYMHMVAPPKVKTGDEVEAGDALGGVGCTGSCWGDHLHFEVREGRGWGGTPQDPMPLLEQALRADGR